MQTIPMHFSAAVDMLSNSVCKASLQFCTSEISQIAKNFLDIFFLNYSCSQRCQNLRGAFQVLDAFLEDGSLFLHFRFFLQNLHVESAIATPQCFHQLLPFPHLETQSASNHQVHMVRHSALQDGPICEQTETTKS